MKSRLDRSIAPAGARRSLRSRLGRALALTAVLSVGLATVSTATAATSTSSAFMTKSLAAAIAKTPSALFNVIVKGKKGYATTIVATDETATITTNPAKGTAIKKQYAVINATFSTMSGKQIQALAKNSHVSAILQDTQTGGLSLSNPQSWPVESEVSSFWPASPAVPAIAVVDSGVDAGRAADFGARVIADANIVANAGNTRDGDGFGHGTFVASIAAGAATGYTGAAPTANIVSVDVLDDTGAGLESDLIDGLDWVYRNKTRYGIKVANVSVLAGSNSSFMYDALDQAVEKLWFSGVVVVTAAGNYGVNGQATGFVYAPANDPFAITVGAADPGSTADTSDDFNAPWSAFGYTPDGFAKPELGAVGRYLNGAAPATSTMAVQHPERIVSPGYMWMSGTSFAAPVVSGAAAYVLAAHPDWTSDQVKGALMLTAAQPAVSTSPNSLGVGMVKASQASLVSNPPNPNAGLDQFVSTDPNGGSVFDAASWSSAAQTSASWNSASWSSASWSSASWSSASWSSASWSSASWSSASWSSGQTVDGSLPSASWSSLTWVR